MYKRKMVKENNAHKESNSTHQRKRPHFVKSKDAKAEPLGKIVWPEYICERCGKPIKDLTLALSNKESGKPVHFDCIISFIKSSEKLLENEEVIYIGNGNFAIVWFENPKVRKKFKIRKLIEWEEENAEYEWRIEMAQLGSSIEKK